MGESFCKISHVMEEWLIQILKENRKKNMPGMEIK